MNLWKSLLKMKKSAQNMFCTGLLRIQNNVFSNSTNYAFSAKVILTGGLSTKNQLIKIVFYQLIKIFIISWPKFLTLFSWSKKNPGPPRPPPHPHQKLATEWDNTPSFLIQELKPLAPTTKPLSWILILNSYPKSLS